MNILKMYFAQIFIDNINSFLKINKFEYFDPHKNKTVEDSLQCARLDSYYGLFDRDIMIGYGMLRGMDEGYEIPMLGIAIDKNYQGLGLGKLMMSFLEAEARVRGYEAIKLRVHADNKLAINFYYSCGYSMSEGKDGIITMVKEL